MESYPRRKQLYKHKDKPEIFNFTNENEYEAKLKEGYVFDPADLTSQSILAEDIPPQVPPFQKFSCDVCDFSGKNKRALRFHRFKKHGLKTE